MKTFYLFSLIIFFIAVNVLSQNFIPAPEFITNQFKKYNIICLDEGPHGTIQSHAFIRNLISDDRVKNLLNYVIIEFANTDYQDILDRFIKGDDVPLKELRRVWRNTTQAHSPLFEMPVYLQLLKTIRENNLNQPADKQIRVLAGDPPIDWNKINSIRDYFKNISQRDVLSSELAIKYGIDSGKKVLMIYGGEHVVKTANEKKDSTFWTIPFYINKKTGIKALTIGILKTGDFNIQNNSIPVNSICDISTVESPFSSLKDRFDALYYAGDSNLWEIDIPEKINAVYWNELNRRSKIVWGEGIDESLKDGSEK